MYDEANFKKEVVMSYEPDCYDKGGPFCNCERCLAKKHSKTCCCDSCVKFGYNQKPFSAPDNHSVSCRCDSCTGNQRNSFSYE